MYRIRLATGAETTFTSIDELTSALQSGTVTSEALIYHQRADRWLTITNHPHYQVALSRAASPGSNGDGARRQVVPGVRPVEKPVGPARSQLVDVVAQIDKDKELQAPRKLTIPGPKKPEPGLLRAQENVLEGVVIERSRSGENGPGIVAQQTTVLPIRSAEPARAAAPAPVAPPAPAPAAPRVTVATPQVDKLLEMLDPGPPAAPVLPPLAEVPVIDLSAPTPVKGPVLDGPAAVTHRVVAQEPHPAPAPIASHRSRQSPKMIGIAAGAVLVIGAAIFLWKPWASASKSPAENATVASTALPRTEAFGGSTSNPAPTTSQITGSNMPGSSGDSAKRREKPVDSAPAIVRVRAPRNLNVRLPAGNLIAGTADAGITINAPTLIQHYNAAYTEVRSELELRMLQIGFTQIFLRSRLQSRAGVQDTRRLIASATSALRQYRDQEVQIERAYSDTIGVAGRKLDWAPRDLSTWNTKPSQRETAENLRLTNLMLSQMDSTFRLLAEQEGEYSVSGDAITFQSSAAAQQYGALRSWLNQQADKYAGSGDALPATLRQVVKAIGATRLPQERH